MKKILLLLSSAIAIFALVALPLACSHTEEEKDTNKADKVLREFKGHVLYGEKTSDDASACLTDKADGSIGITLATGLPLYQFCFNNVTVSLQGDTSVLKAQNQTIDAGNDKQFTLTLQGYLKGDTLFLEITGNELTAPLIFVTDKSLLNKEEDKECQADGPTASYLEAYNCEWEGTASFDGGAPTAIAFSSALSETGEFSIGLGQCSFGEKMPPMEISLDDMCFFASEKGFPNFTFAGNAANYNLQGMKGSTPATTDGNFANGTLKLKLEITIANKAHTIEITDAKAKE